jgi:branched-chain amino acid transport system permease protein
MHRIPWSLLVFIGLAAYPFIPWPGYASLDAALALKLDQAVGATLPTLFVFAILGLALNVVLGNAGQLHLGIAAFFGIGAFVMGMFRVGIYPFQFGFGTSLLIAVIATSLVGVVVSSPILRLRGDYLALVTLGFGVITITLLRKFDEITGGKQSLGPIEPPIVPEFIKDLLRFLQLKDDWPKEVWLNDYRLYYYLTLVFLAAVSFVLRNLEMSRLGRAWLAIREDELAATCMGINVAKLKLGAFALSAAIAGLAGALYATKMRSTLEPTFYDFSLSATVLCAVILGGLGNRNGVLLGVFFIFGFEYLFARIGDGYLQRQNFNPEGKNYLKFNNWKLLIFGMALILMMRFRPHGILPEGRSSKTPSKLKKPTS